MAWHSPFDLYYWFVNVFAGSMEVFLAIAFLVIAALSGMFRMPNIITGMMFAAFVIMLSASVDVPMFVLVLLFIAIMIGYSLARLFKS
jgi:hypothetical protein